MEPIAKLEIKKTLNTERLIISGVLIVIFFSLYCDLSVSQPKADVGILLIISILLFVIGILPELIAFFIQKPVRLEISSSQKLYVIFRKEVVFKCFLERIDSIWIEKHSINFVPMSAILKVYVKEENSILGNEFLMLSLSDVFSLNKIRVVEVYRIYDFLKQHNEKVRLTIY